MRCWPAKAPPSELDASLVCYCENSRHISYRPVMISLGTCLPRQPRQTGRAGQTSWRSRRRCRPVQRAVVCPKPPRDDAARCGQVMSAIGYILSGAHIRVLRCYRLPGRTTQAVSPSSIEAFAAGSLPHATGVPESAGRACACIGGSGASFLANRA